MGSMLFFSFLEWFIILLGCFFTGVYCILMYVRVSHGSSSFSYFNYFTLKDFCVNVGHCFFVLFYPFIFFTF